MHWVLYLCPVGAFLCPCSRSFFSLCPVVLSSWISLTFTSLYRSVSTSLPPPPFSPPSLCLHRPSLRVTKTRNFTGRNWPTPRCLFTKNPCTVMCSCVSVYGTYDCVSSYSVSDCVPTYGMYDCVPTYGMYDCVLSTSMCGCVSDYSMHDCVCR